MNNGTRVQSSPTSSLEVRDRLVEALELDLVGPGAGHRFAEEMLPGWIRPSNWYLTGFLIPSGAPAAQRSDPDADDAMVEVPEHAGLAEESTEERRAAKKSFFPSSLGLSFLVAPESDSLSVAVDWGDYSRVGIEGSRDQPLPVWHRTPRQAVLEAIPMAESGEPQTLDVPDAPGLQLVVVVRRFDETPDLPDLPAGTRSVSIFLVNNRAPIAKGEGDPDAAYVFQPVLEVRSAGPLVPRPDPRSLQAQDWDGRVADLHYADTREFATGHGVSADWNVEDEVCRRVRTRWLPVAEVEKTTTTDVFGLELGMFELGSVKDGVAVQSALAVLVDEYRRWIAHQRTGLGDLTHDRAETARQLLRHAGIAANRIERGIATLAQDPDALDAFRLANRAVGRALQKRLGIDTPRWRVFQLAFMLLNLPGIADPSDPEREIVDLLFFPTGGGKTEAYLGLAAFTMVLRRLRHPEDNGHAGAGVSVIMRYTLRLLTLDQLSRAAGLVCALELEREDAPDRYGQWPFEIGLWVGKASTPNHLGRKGDSRSDSARAKVRQFQNDPRGKPSPIPLEKCPWCDAAFQPSSFMLRPNSDHPKEMRIVCANFECDFIGDRPLPIVAVDEPLYRRLPAFLIATVDKFAALPWVGTSGVLLGGADRYDKDGFYGAAESGGRQLSSPLPHPDLIIQDELHLISGPLGTMVGLYETALESLCVTEVDGTAVKPKIVASTATVRQAQDQIQALFARPLTQVFPPPGPDRRDSFFARVVPASEVPARMYLGIASKGRNPKVLMRRTLLALMGAAEKAYRDAGGHKAPDNPADPYMTVLGYFNSLRELGGARRIMEEEVQNTLKSIGRERRRIGPRTEDLLQDRKSVREVVELTSRVSTDKVAEARRKLGASFDQDDRVDLAIATNMISVGLDIPRLGLMVVVGQPKTHSEYIQATSRVGRADTKPGLVVTLLNAHKPRDRSHYERFRHYHETFYRAVEVPSVTPFSARSLDRGMAGTVVGLARHALPELTAPRNVQRIDDVRSVLEERLLKDFMQRIREQPLGDEEEREECLRSVQNRIVDLLDSWSRVAKSYKSVGAQLQYQKYELPQGQPLLRGILEEQFESEHHRKFRANRSLRDVEPQVNIFVRDLTGGGLEHEE